MVATAFSNLRVSFFASKTSAVRLLIAEAHSAITKLIVRLERGTARRFL
jgi:hypothetical protein